MTGFSAHGPTGKGRGAPSCAMRGGVAPEKRVDVTWEGHAPPDRPLAANDSEGSCRRPQRNSMSPFGILPEWGDGPEVGKECRASAERTRGPGGAKRS
jgi:hypothetical protein